MVATFRATMCGMQHMQIGEVCAALGVTRSVLRRKMVKNGIRAWPYRQLRALGTHIAMLEDLPTLRPEAKGWLEEMRAEQDRILRGVLSLQARDVAMSISFKRMLSMVRLECGASVLDSHPQSGRRVAGKMNETRV